MRMQNDAVEWLKFLCSPRKLNHLRANLGSSSVSTRTFSTWRGLREAVMKGLLKAELQLCFPRTMFLRTDRNCESLSFSSSSLSRQIFPQIVLNLVWNWELKGGLRGRVSLILVSKVGSERRDRSHETCSWKLVRLNEKLELFAALFQYDNPTSEILRYRFRSIPTHSVQIQGPSSYRMPDGANKPRIKWRLL